MIKQNKKLNWTIVALWMLLIFYLSNQPSLKSPLSSNIDFLLRKIAHISEFAILTYFLIKSFNRHNIRLNKSIILSVVISLSYAFLDEFHQIFIFERVGSIRDVFIDSIGIFIMAIIYKKMK